MVFGDDAPIVGSGVQCPGCFCCPASKQQGLFICQIGDSASVRGKISDERPASGLERRHPAVVARRADAAGDERVETMGARRDDIPPLVPVRRGKVSAFQSPLALEPLRHDMLHGRLHAPCGQIRPAENAAFHPCSIREDHGAVEADERADAGDCVMNSKLSLAQARRRGQEQEQMRGQNAGTNLETMPGQERDPGLYRVAPDPAIRP